MVSYLVHMSLLCAVNGSYWVFYAGVERAVVNRVRAHTHHKHTLLDHKE